VFQGIVLHRWAVKWGNTKAILIIGLLYGILSYYNFINGFITGIILCLLYIKSKTLIVPIIFRIINLSIGLIIEAYYFFAIQSNSDNILQQFRSEFKLGMILSAISTPYILWWLYKNWLKKNEELPYFANALSLEDKS
ncbi:MAG: lysostaphin resistance A-like protein, partial [Waterburya sp.]